MPIPKNSFNTIKTKIRQQVQFACRNEICGIFSGFKNFENQKMTKSISLNSSIEGGPATMNPCISEKESNSDEVVFSLCFAAQTICVKVLYASHQPWLPPDILIDDEDFMEELNSAHLVDNVGVLNSWFMESEKSLHLLMTQLFQLYKNYHLALMKHKYEEVSCRYEEIVAEDSIYNEVDVEVMVGSSLQSIAIRLAVDFGSVPDSLLEQPGENLTCVLCFIKPTCDKEYSAQLMLSPAAERLLDVANTRNLSHGSCDAGASLGRQAAAMALRVQEAVRELVHNFEDRKKLVAQLLCDYNSAVSSYDGRGFTSAELILCHEASQTHYMCDIELPKAFPRHSPPLVKLRSISTGDKPASMTVPKVPHDATSEPETVVTQILAAVEAFAPTFCRKYY